MNPENGCNDGGAHLVGDANVCFLGPTQQVALWKPILSLQVLRGMDVVCKVCFAASYISAAEYRDMERVPTRRGRCPHGQGDEKKEGE
jgi:hypothetical protein